MTIKQGDFVRVVNVGDSVDLAHQVGREGYMTDIFDETPTGELGYYVRFGGPRDEGMMFYEHELEVVKEIGKPERLAFPQWDSAVEYAEKHGGWLFLPKKSGPVEWFNASIYTWTRIMNEADGDGFIGTASAIKEMCE